MEVNGVAVIFGQRAHGVQHAAILKGIRGRQVLVQLGVFLVGSAGQVVAAVDGHPQQPGLEMLLTLKAAAVVQQLFKYILHHILRIGGAVAIVHGGTEHRVAVSLHGQRKNFIFG